MNAYRRDFDKTKCFFIKDEQFLEKCNEIVENVSNRIKKNKLIVNLHVIKNI